MTALGFLPTERATKEQDAPVGHDSAGRELQAGHAALPDPRVLGPSQTRGSRNAPHLPVAPH